MPRWTKKEIKKLKEMYLDDPQKLVKEFNRSELAIKAKINRLGLKRRHWTKEQEDKLKELYPKEDIDVILDKFPNKTEKSIREKARRLGVKSKNRSKVWGKKEKNILRRYYYDSNKEKLKKLLSNRSWEQIVGKANNLGLSRTGWEINIPKNKLYELYFEKDFNIRECKDYFNCSNVAILKRLKTWFSEEFKEKIKRVEMKYTIEKIKEIIRNENYKLLDYKDVNGFIKTKSYITISCPNQDHKPYQTRLNSFIIGQRCRKCFIERNSGENNSSYNPDLTEEERNAYRFVKKYQKWREKVYERDNYTCQICRDNSGGNLQAHHLDSYDQNKNKRTNVNNGITLCKGCHQKFHSEYGYGGNTKEQFEIFKEEYHVVGVV